MLVWQLLHPRMTMAHLGLIPEFLDESDPRPAKEQFNENYVSGWNPMPDVHMDLKTLIWTYFDDPPYVPVAALAFRDELILFYPGEWVAIVHEDGGFEVSRMN